MDRLFLRALPLKERITVVDAASMPTADGVADSIRARAENWLQVVGAREKSTSRTCASILVCVELVCVCRRIDLVLSSTIGHTVAVFTDPMP